MRPNLTESSDPDTTLGVSTDDLLNASDLLHAEATRIGKALYLLPATGFQPCAGDPVSIAAAAAFNEKSQELVNSYEAHVDELKRQADVLASSAHAYRATESDAGQAFGSR